MKIEIPAFDEFFIRLVDALDRMAEIQRQDNEQATFLRVALELVPLFHQLPGFSAAGTSSCGEIKIVGQPARIWLCPDATIPYDEFRLQAPNGKLVRARIS